MPLWLLSRSISARSGKIPPLFHRLHWLAASGAWPERMAGGSTIPFCILRFEDKEKGVSRPHEAPLVQPLSVLALIPACRTTISRHRILGTRGDLYSRANVDKSFSEMWNREECGLQRFVNDSCDLLKLLPFNSGGSGPVVWGPKRGCWGIAFLILNLY